LAAAAAGLNRTIYTAQNGTQLPGSKVRSEGDGPSGDAAVDEAYTGLGATYQLYHDAFARNSLDDNGLPLIASVHFGQQYDNAEWNGQQMLFGDGDGTYFNRFTVAIDVIGHELTHGVTQYTSGLEYRDQPGALNESFSDVFGSMVKQFTLNQRASEADWLIGEGLLTDAVQSGDPSHGPALRSMLKPGTAFNDPVFGKDPQPDNMSGFVHTPADNGGVHTNSGIPNRAFALASLNIGGYSWQGAGQIWYQTLLRLPSTAQFQDAADLTYQVAGEGSGGPTYQRAVKDAWAQVGIRIRAPSMAGRLAREDDRHGDLADRIKSLEEQVRRLTELVSKKSTGQRPREAMV
jgi:Zn-dependent metalloprotease